MYYLSHHLNNIEKERKDNNFKGYKEHIKNELFPGIQPEQEDKS